MSHVKNVTCEKCHICHRCKVSHLSHVSHVIQCDSFCSWFIILNVIGLRFTTLGAFTLLLGPHVLTHQTFSGGARICPKREGAPLPAPSQNKSKHYNGRVSSSPDLCICPFLISISFPSEKIHPAARRPFKHHP